MKIGDNVVILKGKDRKKTKKILSIKGDYVILEDSVTNQNFKTKGEIKFVARKIHISNLFRINNDESK